MGSQEHKTVGAIAAAAGCTRDHVQYVIRSRGIKYDSTAGFYRLYAPVTVQRVLEEIELSKQNTLATRSARQLAAR